MAAGEGGHSVLVVGEVLFDEFDNGRRLGGAPLNCAFHLHRLGIPVRFVSRVGDDEKGNEIRGFLSKNEFPIEDIQIGSGESTGVVTVTTNPDGTHRFEILEDRAYDFIEEGPLLKLVEEVRPSHVYFGTLALRHPKSKTAIRKLVEALSDECTFIVDLNLRSPFYMRDDVLFAIRSADCLKINEEELEVLRKMFSLEGRISAQVESLMHQYNIQSVCVTLGEMGSMGFERDSLEPVKTPASPVDHFVDSVGAGDAFCAMWIASTLNGFPLQEALNRASQFSSGICSLSGALPDNPDYYIPYHC